MVGIVLVSHSFELARGLADLAAQVAGPDVRIEGAGGGPEGSLGTSGDAVQAAIDRAESGDGVVVLADLGSSILTVRHLLEDAANGQVRLADAPLVEGAVAAAVISSTSQPLEVVLQAAEEARGARKL
ncbi:MAG: PTS-dependent dihydroxyacetone kinase phosphotransferase subunit DhaM [Candidatus Dormibacteraeota bacterium]|uniref:phosphoenolpyruvate--glycerone phosphotransferase n=1 Tax=Candidatus Dormiibacter inghamiae TaxID=3127013 RepID=A0A934KG76_9BACT|nr:PTS-dependent dihydroxyacetone kinase phosphotransferase subunit DhaM [Candidatus Dormibacteraeota bacterium]MBJ7606688.1 PTS-dependent dihydroxyacetone kinase phosphotransferase subunit DhaM [Candidatus Dormibacteraeota bacterium]